MKISVIIPTYNRAHTILRALESVIKQQCANFDVWIIDDGSTDNTAQIVQQYIGDNFLKQKVFYHFIKNSGVSAARNTGIKLSDGDWIAFLDSDDEWKREKLCLQTKFIEKNNNCQLIHTNEIWIRNGKQINQKKIHHKSGGDIFERSLHLCLISPSAVMIRRSLLESIGLFDPKMTVCEDYDLWLRICSQYSVDYIDTALIIKYGGAADQLSHQYVAMDYWRVLSIDKVIRLNYLSLEYRQVAISVLIKKAEILLCGYQKHNNLKNYAEVERILQHYSEKSSETYS